ncbi:MAG: heat shock protein HspQ [Planctomycetota bacterium]
MSEPAFEIPDYLPEDLPQFGPGQIVRHCRYGYRGLIIDFDMRCLADESWYENNQTQPDREQPWYHVLVDGSSTVTYSAEENLVPEEFDQGPIEHPLLEALFEAQGDDGYRRNDRPWPGWR